MVYLPRQLHYMHGSGPTIHCIDVIFTNNKNKIWNKYYYIYQFLEKQM